jgi:hypothetical protein
MNNDLVNPNCHLSFILILIIPRISEKISHWLDTFNITIFEKKNRCFTLI